jgi:glycosyltransferase involved in cell wall biosynthesis
MAQQELDRRVAERPAGTARSAPPISCYIRTLNEERRIRDAVRAALQVAEDVVLIDSGSTDATLAIAEAEGARVIGQPWLGNGRQKRVGEDAARHDWVLDIDADEVVTPELAAEIRGVFAAGPQFQMYELTLITVPPFGAPWRNFKRAYRVKLYNKQHIRIPDHAAWDQFKVPPGAKLGKLHQPILHYAFAGMEHVIAKLNRASSVRAREAKLKPLWNVILRIVFGLPLYFLKEYFVNGLIRGGVYGFAYACAIAFGRWLRDVKMYERHQRER